MYKKYVKRIFDFLLSIIGIVVLSPLLLIIAIAIKIDSKGPVIFKQQRFKKDKKLFHIIKFRTMNIDTPRDVPTHLLENPEIRITRMGRLLRKSSLDELPQLFNIVSGNMSIVGPRPALYNQLDLIEDRDKCGANSVRPGLTGLAQVSGRDELSVSRKAEVDGTYVDNLSIAMDFKCLCKTVTCVLTRYGVAEGRRKSKNIERKQNNGKETMVNEDTDSLPTLPS